jgi:multiple sugar transport system substrate-binding protein
VNSPAGLKALSFLRSTITAGVTPAADATFGATTPGTVFDEGHTAFMAANAYQWPGVAKSGMKSKVGIAAQPTFPGGPATGAAATGGSASFINPSSKHLQADVKFVEFLTTKTAEFDVAKVGGLAPSSTAVQTNPSVDAINPPAGLLPHLTLVNRPAAEANYPAVTAAISANVNAVISGIASPASALAKMSSEINTALKSSAG